MSYILFADASDSDDDCVITKVEPPRRKTPFPESSPPFSPFLSSTSEEEDTSNPPRRPRVRVRRRLHLSSPSSIKVEEVSPSSSEEEEEVSPSSSEEEEVSPSSSEAEVYGDLWCPHTLEAPSSPRYSAEAPSSPHTLEAPSSPRYSAEAPSTSVEETGDSPQSPPREGSTPVAVVSPFRIGNRINNKIIVCQIFYLSDQL